MRTVALILVWAVAGRAEDRTALLDRILTAEAGTPVQIRMENQALVAGRLLRVENGVVQVQVAEAGVVTLKDVPMAQIASFQVVRGSEFGKGFRRGAGRALGAMAVFMGIGLLVSLANH